jgi:hypothetical protein
MINCCCTCETHQCTGTAQVQCHWCVSIDIFILIVTGVDSDMKSAFCPVQKDVKTRIMNEDLEGPRSIAEPRKQAGMHLDAAKIEPQWSQRSNFLSQIHNVHHKRCAASDRSSPSPNPRRARDMTASPIQNAGGFPPFNPSGVPSSDPVALSDHFCQVVQRHALSIN